MKSIILSVLMTAAISTGLATSAHGLEDYNMTIGSPVNISTNNQEQPITIKLKKMLDENPHIKMMLIESINEAKKENPSKIYNPVQSLEKFYSYVDKWSVSLPGEMPPGTSYYKNGNLTKDAIHQNILYFHFLINQPLERLKGKNYFYNSLQFNPIFNKWLYEFTVAKGVFLNSPDSWSDLKYEQYKKIPDFNLQSDLYGNKNIWKTYNEFFSRNVLPGKRPITGAGDPEVVVSPADSQPQGVWRINPYSQIDVKSGYKIKFMRYFNIANLLGHDSPYKYSFNNGYFTHTYLNVNDFHRYLYPVSGKILDKKIIKQNISILTTWDNKKKMYVVNNALNGWQFSQIRGYVILQTKEYGLVAIIPIGMEQVSSINFLPNAKIGSYHKKGNELGYFLFGASDIIMLFQEKSNFNLTDKKENGTYKELNAGQQYGNFSHK